MRTMLNPPSKRSAMETKSLKHVNRTVNCFVRGIFLVVKKAADSLGLPPI